MDHTIDDMAAHNARNRDTAAQRAARNAQWNREHGKQKRLECAMNVTQSKRLRIRLNDYENTISTHKGDVSGFHKPGSMSK